MKSALSEMRLLKLLILLTFSGICSANIRTCFTSLRAWHGFSPYITYMDVVDDVHEAFMLSCDEAEILCYKYMIPHLNEVLGDGVAYIRGTAGTNLCNMIQLEIPPTDPSHVYAYWSVSNCGRTGYMYLGQICCWKYYIGDVEVYVNNPECTQCEKPECEHNQTATGQPEPTEQPNFLESLGLSEAQRGQAMNEEKVHFQVTSGNGKKLPLRSGKLRGLNHMDLNEMEEEEEQMSSKDAMREKFLKNLQE